MKAEDFALAWRWTDAQHSLLPASVLSDMEPLSPDQSKRAHELSQRFPRGSGLTTSADIPEEEVRHWLQGQHGALNDRVTISWSSELALRTSWKTFTEHWSDFCYPSSDDVTIWPDSGDWALFYAHYEEFEFQKRPIKKTDKNASMVKWAAIWRMNKDEIQKG